MELPSAPNCESHQRLQIFVHLLLSESRGQIEGGENAGIGSTDIADAFGDFLHGILVDVGMEV